MNISSRQEFAASRPLPAFGVILGVLVDAMQLTDPGSYSSCGKSDKQAELAAKYLAERTFDRIKAGELVKTTTRVEICTALAKCIVRVPINDIDQVPVEWLANFWESAWEAYEHISDRLSKLVPKREYWEFPLWRHLTMEFAVRSGAAAFLCGDDCANEPRPVWSDASSTKRALRDMAAAIGTRSELAEKLIASESEVDRWLDGQDLPSVTHVVRWQNLFESKNVVEKPLRTLWRLVCARRLWLSVENHMPIEIRRDCLTAYQRVQSACHRHFETLRKGNAELARKHAVHVLARGRICSVEHEESVLQDEKDPIWRWHLESICERKPGWDPLVITQMCETYANAELARREFQSMRGVIITEHMDQLVRAQLSILERKTPLGLLATFVKAAEVCEQKGDFAGAEAALKTICERFGETTAIAHSLGRLALCMGRPNDAEQNFRRALVSCH